MRPRRHRVCCRSWLVLGLAAIVAAVSGCGSDNQSVAGFTQNNLVSNVAGKATNTDLNLVGTVGIASPSAGAWMVANAGSGTSTAYDGNGDPFPAGTGTVVTIAAGAASPPGSHGVASGVVANPTSAFVITGPTGPAPSDFIFATFDGTIAGWSAAVDESNAIIAVDNSATGTLYTALTMGSNPSGGAFLYAASFRYNAIAVFDETFAPVTPAGSFIDPRLPTNYAPYGLANIAGDIYVAYAKQNPQKIAAVPGQGLGFVSVFDTEGNFVRRFTSQGQLNAPWGIAQAPASFSRFGGALIIGNTGDGHINAFDPVSGHFLGQLQHPSGGPLTIRGLWGIAFGNGGTAGSVDTLYFTAGPAGGTEGLFGSVTPG
jgi:uncharacterized protein (TIGR03118 family)